MEVRQFGAGFAVAGAMLLAGCGTEEGTAVRDSASDSPVASSSSNTGECAASADGYLSATHEADEPTFSVPVVDGWERVPQFEKQMIRLAAANKSLIVDKFAPNYVVTVEKAPASGRAEFDRQLMAVTRIAEGGSVKQHPESTTCGFPSLVADYRLRTETGVLTDATVLVVSVPGEPSPTTATLTIQSPDPDNAEYTAAKKTVIDGFRVQK